MELFEPSNEKVSRLQHLGERVILTLNNWLEEHRNLELEDEETTLDLPSILLGF
jgi:hypothetical protein